MSLKRMLTSRSCRIKVGLTMGDPSGIGPAILKDALKIARGLAHFTVIGDRRVFDRSGKAAAKTYTDTFVDMHNMPQGKFELGKIKPGYGRASLEYIDKALELVETRQIDCLVTCPVSKAAINKAGFDFHGHTEYLARRVNVQNFAMMLLNGRLKISLVTRHIPIRDVPYRLHKDKILQAILLTADALQKFFSIKEPRLAVCALNPHASDNGLIGSEEEAVIRPALRSIRKRFKHIEGPLPADAAIAKAYNKEYDCVIAMYHDQALIPLKLLGNQAGVNITLGLPFVRTSPLHGVAFDIAANNSANPAPLVEAIKLAVRCTLNLRKG